MVCCCTIYSIGASITFSRCTQWFAVDIVEGFDDVLTEDCAVNAYRKILFIALIFCNAANLKWQLGLYPSLNITVLVFSWCFKFKEKYLRWQLCHIAW